MMLAAASRVIQLRIDELDCRCSKSEGILEVKDLSVETGCMRSRAEFPTDGVMGVMLCRWSER